ncbi:unnamed protein product [Lactuca virosa]|uniref:non-specific serine/threonine protein kinase n=1 Tax=Lactuca virosa TaxID=75947 RepID=A0AAU9N9F6_9ASTR|nr:unnamed protein product [Lactuca virosa]
MNPKHFLLNFLTLIVLGECSTTIDKFYGTCNDSFTCGTISGFQFPFRRQNDPTNCGYPGFEINCDEHNPPTFTIKNMTYQIQNIDPTVQILKIVREDMIESICPQDQVNTTMDYNLFDFNSGYMNMSFLFGCPDSWTGMGGGFDLCGNNGGKPVFLTVGVHGPGDCGSSVVVPVPVEFVEPNASGRVVGNGFEVRWKVDDEICTGCRQSGGQCMYDNSTRLTGCSCPNQPLPATTIFHCLNHHENITTSHHHHIVIRHDKKINTSGHHHIVLLTILFKISCWN